MFNCLEGCYRIAPFWKFGKQIKQYTGRTNNNWSLENAVSHSLAEGTATRNTLFLAINSYCQSTPNSNKHANQTHGSSRCELGLVLLLLLNPIFWESNTLSASVSPTVPRRVCHKFIKSMSKKFSWCRRWTTQSKTTKRLQFYHFAIAMANVSSIYLKTFFLQIAKDAMVCPDVGSPSPKRPTMAHVKFNTKSDGKHKISANSPVWIWHMTQRTDNSIHKHYMFPIAMPSVCETNSFCSCPFNAGTCHSYSNWWNL